VVYTHGHIMPEVSIAKRRYI